MILDDDPMIIKGLTMFMETLGYQVSGAGDGSSAVEILKRNFGTDRPILAAILDISLPGGQSGVDVLASLKAIDPQIKAIITSCCPIRAT